MLTLRLLDLAKETSVSLAIASTEGAAERVSSYQETLSELHGTLRPHADLIHAYTPIQSNNHMYQSRVELKLADYRRKLLQDILELERGTLDGSQRKR